MVALRPYQSRSVDFLLARSRAFVKAPAGSGKTVIASDAVAKKAEPFDRVLWIANTIEQCQQAKKACEAAPFRDGVSIDICCAASKPDASSYDIVVIDESHHLPAKTWWMSVATTNATVWGFSATPFTGDWERDDVLKAFFGEENFITIPREEVIEGGSLANGIVYIHDIDDPGEFERDIIAKTIVEVERRARRWPRIPRFEHERRARWQFTAEAVRDNPKRNAKITELANASDAVLILVSSIEHGAMLAEGITGSVLVHAKLPKKKRAEAIADFRSGKLRVMIATSLADEGLDVPRAAVLILASGGRSAGKLEQRAGRVMRPHAGKDFGTVHDFLDQGAGLACNQAKARLRTYKKLGYTIHR